MGDAKLFAVQRRERILKEVSTSGFVTVPEMARACGVSEMTLRRDLDQLSDRGLVSRVHGGAIPPGGRPGPTVDLVEPSVDTRLSLNHESKVMIARQAMTMIRSDQTIALDVGTTTFELSEVLTDLPLRIFTNSLKIASRLGQSSPTVYVLGGQVSGTEPSVVGLRAIQSLGDYRFDLAFIGVSGISAEGFFDYSPEDTEVKKKMIARAQRSVVLADASKFDRMSVAFVAGLNEIDTLVTDKEPPRSLRDALDDAGVLVEVVPGGSQDNRGR